MATSSNLLATGEEFVPIAAKLGAQPDKRFVRERLERHLRRRSQRGWRARAGISISAHLEHLGLVAL